MEEEKVPSKIGVVDVVGISDESNRMEVLRVIDGNGIDRSDGKHHSIGEIEMIRGTWTT